MKPISQESLALSLLKCIESRLEGDLILVVTKKNEIAGKYLILGLQENSL